MPDEIVNDFANVRRDDELVMFCREFPGHAARVLQLVVAVFMKPNRKSLNGPISMSRHQTDNRARINSTGKKGAERHVRNQAHAHRLIE